MQIQVKLQTVRTPGIVKKHFLQTVDRGMDGRVRVDVATVKVVSV